MNLQPAHEICSDCGKSGLTGQKFCPHCGKPSVTPEAEEITVRKGQIEQLDFPATVFDPLVNETTVKGKETPKLLSGNDDPTILAQKAEELPKTESIDQQLTDPQQPAIPNPANEQTLIAQQPLWYAQPIPNPYETSVPPQLGSGQQWMPPQQPTPIPGGQFASGQYQMQQPFPQPPVTPAPRKSNWKKITLIAVLVLMLLSFVGMIGYSQFDAGKKKMQATATAQSQSLETETAIANAHATATQVYAEATALAATATAEANKNPYAPDDDSILVLDDSLKGTTSDWSDQAEKTGTCKLESDGYHVTATATHAMTCIYPSLYTDFTFSIDVNISEGNCGGFGKGINEQNAYVFFICRNGSYRFAIRENGVPDKSIGDTSLYDGTNTLAMRVKDGQVKFFINQQLVKSLDNTLVSLSGGIGLLAGSDLEETEVVFTNAKLWTSGSSI